MSAPLISVCVATFRRPLGLSRLLASLRNLDPATPSFEVVVVDNDARRSAEPMVREAQAGNTLDLRYFVEPAQNIATARNRSILHAQGQWVAFIDDDEEADPAWLLELWKIVQSENADGAFGTVRRLLPSDAPNWVKSSWRELSRRDGAREAWYDLATGNALIRRSAMMSLSHLFDPSFGLTGGEDCDLFYRMIRSGSILVGCSTGIVYESVSPHRFKLRVILLRYICEGIVFGRIGLREESAWRACRSFPRLLAKGFVLAVAGGFSFLVSPALGISLLAKAARYLGILPGYLGLFVKRYGTPHDVPSRPEESAGRAPLESSVGAGGTHQGLV